MAKLVVAFGNFVNASEKESDLPRFIKFSDWKVRERERETEREREIGIHTLYPTHNPHARTHA